MSPSQSTLSSVMELKWKKTSVFTVVGRSDEVVNNRKRLKGEDSTLWSRLWDTAVVHHLFFLHVIFSFLTVIEDSGEEFELLRVMQLEGRSTQWRDTANQAQLPHILTFQRLYFPYHSVEVSKLAKILFSMLFTTSARQPKEKPLGLNANHVSGSSQMGTDLCPMTAGNERSAWLGDQWRQKGGHWNSRFRLSTTSSRHLKGPTTFKISCITWDGCMSKKNPWANTRYSSRLVLVATPLELRLRATNPWELISH